MSKTVAVFSSALLCLLFVSTASLRAQGTPPPDFTGVYSPIDPFGQALVEIAVFSAAAIAWWTMGQPVVAGVFAVVAAVSGIIHGRKQLSD